TQGGCRRLPRRGRGWWRGEGGGGWQGVVDAGPPALDPETCFARSAFAVPSGSRERTMDHATPSMAFEAESLREAYAALNRNDIPGFTAIFDPQIERIEPADFPMAGTYRGLEAVRAHVAKGRGTWAEGSC